MENTNREKQIFGSRHSLPVAAIISVFNSQNPHSAIFQRIVPKYQIEPESEPYPEEDSRLNSDLGIVTLKKINNSSIDQVGIDRDTLKQIGGKRFRELSQFIELFKPTERSVDPRKNKKLVFEADPKLSEILGTDVVIKELLNEQKYSLYSGRGDGLTPEQQFEAGKIIQRVVEEVGLSEIVKVNKAFGYIQGKNQNYLFLEKVDGYNFKQLTHSNNINIPKKKLDRINEVLISKLNEIKEKILNDQGYKYGERVYNENFLQKVNRYLEYFYQINDDLNEENRLKMKEIYPDGFNYSSESYKKYYKYKLEALKGIEMIIREYSKEITTSSNRVYDLIAENLRIVIDLNSYINNTFTSQIFKGFGADNLMYDCNGGELIIVDPGPVIQR